jgi:putative ABC transport system permease protein
MRDDFRAALRSFRSTRSFTAAALVVLTLGIGATTAIFSVVDAVVLRGLPFDEHDRLVAVGERYTGPNRSPVPNREPDAMSAVAPQNYADWVTEQRVFESMAAIGSGWMTLREPGAEPESLVPQRVTASFFNVLRVAPALGRAFTASNETAGQDRVAILSDGLWRRRFGADAAIIGRIVPLDDLEADSASGQRGYEVVGVMPPSFAYPVGATRATDIWIPYVIPDNQRIRDPRQRTNYLQVIARLRPDTSLAQAQAQMHQVAAALQQANPVWNKGNDAGVRPLVDHLIGTRIKSWMLMLLAAVGLVLLIACANVASLLLARASARQRDIAVRSALGATRWRLIRQLLVESLVLSAAGTLGAILVGMWAVQVLRASLPETLPRVTTIALNLRVLGATALLSLATGLLFGLFPAFQTTKPDLVSGLKDGGRSGVAAGRQRLRSALVVTEVALAVVLLIAAALFLGSFVSLLRIDPGISPDHVLTAQVSPRIESRTQPRNTAPELSDIARRIAEIPGVAYSSVVSGGIPLAGGISLTTVTIPGKTIDLNDDSARISVRRVTPAYHQALKIPLRRGRLLSATDVAGSQPVAIINESAAKKYFPNEDPLGRTIVINAPSTIIGIVGDVRQTTLEADARPEAYLAMEQERVSGGELVIRTTGDPYGVLPAVKAAVYGVLPDVPLRNIRTMEELIANRMAQRRLNMLLLGLFGVLGLVIAAVGIYGLMAFLVSQRTREIGVRMALGASPARVVTMVLLKAGVLVSTGLLIGSAAAWYVSGVARAFLFRLEPTDPRAYAAAVACLLLASLAASAIPARRAARVDPIVALRAE